MTTNPAEDNARPSRPSGADRRAARRNADVQRYTVDLGREQRLALSLWAAQWEVDKSKIVRTLLYLLEADPTLRARVQAEIFADSDESAED